MIHDINRSNEKYHVIILKMQQKNTIQPLLQILNTLSKLGEERDFLNRNEHLPPTVGQRHMQSETSDMSLLWVETRHECCHHCSHWREDRG